MPSEPQPETNEARMRRPDPDPTIATIALVEKSLAALNDTISAKFEAINKATQLFSENLVRVPTTLDKALAQARDFNDAQFARVMERAAADFSLNAERLSATTKAIDVFKQTVNERFQLGDIQTEKAARDVARAVDAAFSAAKESVGEQNKSNALSITKSEAAFTKQIDQLGATVAQIVKNTDDKISDLKERVLASDAKGSVADPATQAAIRDLANTVAQLSTGANVQTGSHQQSASNMAFIFGIIASVAAIALVAVDFLHK